MKKTDLAYFAGIFDGEGCVTIKKVQKKTTAGNTSRSHSLQVDIGNTNEWLCRQFAFAFGGSVHSQKSTGKRVWRWQVAARKAGAFLEAILPYMRIKRPQVEIALQFQRTRYMRGKKRLTEGELTSADIQRFLIRQFNSRQGNPIYKRNQ